MHSTLDEYLLTCILEYSTHSYHVVSVCRNLGLRSFGSTTVQSFAICRSPAVSFYILYYSVYQPLLPPLPWSKGKGASQPARADSVYIIYIINLPQRRCMRSYRGTASRYSRGRGGRAVPAAFDLLLYVQYLQLWPLHIHRGVCNYAQQAMLFYAMLCTLLMLHSYNIQYIEFSIYILTLQVGILATSYRPVNIHTG